MNRSLLILLLILVTSAAYSQVVTAPVSLPPTDVDETTFTAHWNASPTAPLGGYKLRVDFTFPFGQSGAQTQVFDLGPDVLEKTITPSLGFKGFLVTYKVRAVDAAGFESEDSDIQSFYLIPQTPPFGYPVPCTYPIGQTSFTSPFQPTPATGYSGTLTAVALDEDFTMPIAGSPFASVIGSAGMPITGLTPGTTYWIKYANTNPGVQSGYSQPTFPITTVPATPVLISGGSTATSITIKWDSVPTAKTYLVDVSKDNFVNFLVGYSGLVVNKDTFHTVTGLEPLTSYKVRIRAKGDCDPTPNSNVVEITTIATVTSALAIGNISYSPTQDNATSQTLNISVSGGRTPYVVELNHNKLLSEAITTSPLTPTGTGSYSFVIEPSMLDEIGVAFEVKATDADNTVTKQAGKIYASFGGPGSPSLPFEKFGGTDESWNLFSIPYELDNKSIASIFEGYDPDRHDYDWKIVRYRNSNNDYINFNTGQVKLGEAYWFNAKENIPVKLGAGHATAQVPFHMDLVKGWNLIGNPYPVPISWDGVLANNNANGVERLQVLTANAQSAGDIMAPFAGGFVWSDSETQIDIDPVALAAGGRKVTVVPKNKIESTDPDNTYWWMALRLVSNGTEKELGGVGMHPNASESKDAFDVMTIPRFNAYTDLSTEHSDFFYPWFSTDIVPSQPGYTWNFTLASNQTNGMSSLEWNNEVLQNKKSKIYLFDKSYGTLIDMATQKNYDVDLTGKNFQFEIYFSSDEKPFTPHEVLMADPWPNPASSRVNVPVAIPLTQEIDLAVYDIMGHRITTLAKGTFAAGVYNFTWDLMDDSNRPAGLFICRLAFAGNSFAPIQKKIIVR